MNAILYRISLLAAMVFFFSAEAVYTREARTAHNVMLRAVLVTEDWMPFASTDGWPGAVPTKESEFLKFYEAAIWEETASVHLYEFPNDYDLEYEFRLGVTDEQIVAYREQFAVRKYEGLPPAATPARSVFLKSAFEDIAAYLARIHPDSEHHLKYSGHGGPGGKLFGAEMHANHAGEFLKSWTQSLGRPLGVIDMGGPCNKGGFSDLDNFCAYARYYVASDLPNGGYDLDNWTAAKYYSTHVELHYHRLFAANENLVDVLKARVDLQRTRYENARNNLTTNRLPQANYLYSCSEFRAFSPDFKEFLGSRPPDYSPFVDLKRYMIDNGAPSNTIAKFNTVIVHSADNKDFFPWHVERNGILMPHPEDRIQSPDPVPTVSDGFSLQERTPVVRDAIVSEANLARIDVLNLSNKHIRFLKTGDFDGLTNLTTLFLNNNRLNTLPACIFDGLTKLKSLHLHGNTTDPLSLGVSLEMAGEGRFKAVVLTGAPFRLDLPINVVNGTITGGVTDIIIPAGRIESEPLTVTRITGTRGSVSLEIGVVPNLPDDVDESGVPRHKGYRLVKTEPLSLEIYAAVQATPDFNGDGQTDFADFLLFANAFGGTSEAFDLDESGRVDFADFIMFVAAFRL